MLFVSAHAISSPSICALYFNIILVDAVVKSNNVSEQLGGHSWVEVVKSGHQPILEDTESTTAAMLKLLAKISS